MFIPPLSVAMALDMTYKGAGGETQSTMAPALRLGALYLGEAIRANTALRQLLDTLNPEIEINIANSLWARQGVEFSDEFLGRNREFYRAEVASLNFGDSGALDTIEGWVEDNPTGKIDRREPGGLALEIQRRSRRCDAAPSELECGAILNGALLALGMSVAFSGEAD